MRIEHVELKNIGPHRQLSVELGRGLIGLTGPNGAGKSTLVNAIYAALTNDFSRFSNVKSDIITNGSGKEASYIRLTGEHRNQSFELTRWLRPNKTEFTIGGVSYAKANEVNEAVAAQLNISKLVIDKYVFVDQWEMFGFLNQTGSERAKTFQYLCGTESATLIHKVCNDYVTKKKNTEIIDNSLELETECTELEETVAGYQDKLQECEDDILSDDAVETFKEIISRQVQVEANRETLAETVATIARHKVNLDAFKSTYDECLEKYDRLAGWLAKRGLRIAAATALISNYERWKKLKTAQTQGQKQLDLLNKEASQLAEAAATYAPKDKKRYVPLSKRNTLIESLGILREELKQAKRVISSEDKHCSTCGQAVQAEYVQELRVLCEENKLTLEKLQATLSYSEEHDRLLKVYNERLDDLEVRMQKATERKTSCDEQLAELSLDFQEESGYEDALQLIESRDKAVRQQLDVLNRKNELGEKIARLEGLIKGLTASRNRLQEAQESGPGPGEYEVALQLLDEHVTAKALHQEISGAQSEATRNLQRNKSLLNKLRERQSRHAEAQKLLSVIEEVAEIFHWNNLPKSVSQANLELLVEDINANLELFNNPFYIDADEDLTFQVYLPGKLPVKAKQLSGGQKVILAIAFRAALDRVFGHDVGMMFLDEPTSGLDADNVNYFHDALQQLASKVGNDRQLVVITHVQELSGVFDQVIEIRKD
jgi:exonuclease SbcC